MWPEIETLVGAPERAVVTAIAAATLRARLLVIVEALGCGLAAAAISPLAGVVIAAAVATWRWRSTWRASIVDRLERAQPEAHNLFVTADELSRGVLDATPAIRVRVFADAAARARALDIGVVFPISRVVSVALTAAVVWIAVETVQLWRRGTLPVGAGIAARSTPVNAAMTRPRLQVNVAIQPPAYTGVKETTAVDPEQLQAIEGSAILLSIEASAGGVRLEHDGHIRALTRGADGRLTDRLRVIKTGFLALITDDGARRTIPIVVSPDVLPVVRLTAPGRDLVYAGGNPRIVFDARATDDFGLRSLALHYTRVTGSGENFQFQDGAIPLTLQPANARDWAGRASRSLADLGLKDGDMLVYHAVASDARPGDGSASSDAFIIEVSKLGVAAGDAFTLPEEESKYALSQQMLIVKTERLQQRRSSLAADDLTEQSLDLAVEQRMIRAEFVFMLGGEINDEEVEAEQSVELQAGRLQNRGQRDLRAATIAMSQAEKLLTGTNTAEALVAERVAVAALQRAFSRDRYILRAMATRTQLDSARRLTGNLGEAADWRRTPPEAALDRRTALIEDLLHGMADLGGIADPGDFSPRAVALADEAIRIDPASAPLRQAAGELQRAAAETDAAARSGALASAATAVVAEARRAHAGPPRIAPDIAPALAGAFADGLRRPR